MEGISQTSRARVSLPWGCQPQVWVFLEPSHPGSLGPSLCFCLPGRPGLARELGAAHHCPRARSGLHLLPEAAAAPDDRAEQQGRGQWVQLQRHSRSWVCTGYLCSLSPPPCSLPSHPCMSLGLYYNALGAVMKSPRCCQRGCCQAPLCSAPQPGSSRGPQYTWKQVPWFIAHPRASGGGRALLSKNLRGA